MSVRVFAPAKINLTLQVGRPRADGFHPLQSVVAFADVGDWVEAHPAEEFSLSISGPYAAHLSAADNLVLRAARLLGERVGQNGAALTLEKNLPVASGIGGGSSDTAATLHALMQLWSASLEDTELGALATQLGADVSVCLKPRACYMEGVGERVTPLTLPDLHAVLINPNQPLATVQVFREFDRQTLGKYFATSPPPQWQSAAEAFAGIVELGNDLRAPACALAPVIAALLNDVRQHDEARIVAMSGSGATIFALTDGPVQSASLAQKLGAQFPEYWVRATRLGALDGAGR